MFNLLPTDFTPEELELLHLAASTYAGEFEGAQDISDMTALVQKIERLRLIGQAVRFTYEGETLAGTLEDYADEEGTLMAKVRRGGLFYMVDAKTELLTGP